MSRVPQGLAAVVMREADARGLTYSDYIAVVLAEKHDFPLPEVVEQRPATSVQEELSMQNAS